MSRTNTKRGHLALPFTKKQIEAIAEKTPTPFHLYDEKGIRESARALTKAFAWAPSFKQFYAVKAAPNPYLLKILKSEGFGADCSSLPELLLSERVGITGEDIMFTSNNTPAEEYEKAGEMGAVLNIDDLRHIPFLEQAWGIPKLISFRFNPGAARTGNVIIGRPEEAKYGFTRDQLFEGYRLARDKGATRFGLHTMVASNELDPDYFIETARMMFDLAVEIRKELDITLEFVNLGGGMGIAYKPDDKPLDLEYISKGIRALYEEQNLAPLGIATEMGRIITGPHGYLVSRVRHLKETYKNYAGLDASMANLMRPAIYGAYHHITVLGKEDQPSDQIYDVTGSLCENNDKFAIDRALPKLEPGDWVVIHGAGAHGHSMGFNYNGKLRSAEVLMREDGSVLPIRRAETTDDHFATLDFEGLKNFPV